MDQEKFDPVKLYLNELNHSSVELIHHSNCFQVEICFDM